LAYRNRCAGKCFQETITLLSSSKEIAEQYTDMMTEDKLFVDGSIRLALERPSG
jgi:hypothetical protein